MAFCSFGKPPTQLIRGEQRRSLVHRSAVAERGSSVRSRVAQPTSSSATSSSEVFVLREALTKGNHFNHHQAETLLTVFPSMRDVASKGDIVRLEQAMKAEIVRFEEKTKDEFREVKHAMKADVIRLEEAMKADVIRLEEAMKANMMGLQRSTTLLIVLVALGVLLILGLMAGALVEFPVKPSSALGMVVAALIEKVKASCL